MTKTTGSKKLRNSGRVPGVLYGEGDPQNIELEAVQFEKAVKSKGCEVEDKEKGKNYYAAETPRDCTGERGASAQAVACDVGRSVRVQGAAKID